MSTVHAIDSAGHLDAPIIVQSHLRWDFVWQRPQQLLSRFGRQRQVLFIEEPLYDEGSTLAHLVLTRPLPNVHRAVPVLPASLRSSYDESIATVRELVRRHICADGQLGGLFDAPVHWFYTPMPAPAMIGAFGERAIVYDCMDELAKFRFAPTELVDREHMLLSEADVVFAGGHNLWRSKSRHHHNAHFIGCGVDIAHFGAARSPNLEAARDIMALGTLVAGYVGVIDERLDYPLLAELARQMADVSFVMVGPVVKVSPEELPQAPNIHWLGQRAYADLPSILKSFDVCLMPFALNEATEYINPTKTLEYMAAGKPIVSTPIPDVLHHFTPIVAVGHTHTEFARALQNALVTPDAQLIARGLDLVCENSWEAIVERMELTIAAAVAAREQSHALARAGKARAVGDRTPLPRVAYAATTDLRA